MVSKIKQKIKKIINSPELEEARRLRRESQLKHNNKAKRQKAILRDGDVTTWETREIYPSSLAIQNNIRYLLGKIRK